MVMGVFQRISFIPNEYGTTISKTKQKSPIQTVKLIL